jgi:hypothetical protein
MHRNVVTWIAVCFVLVLSSRENAAAQEARSLDQLQVLVKPGDKVFVTGNDGNVTKGKILGLTSTSLRFLSNGTTRDLREAEVFKIQQRRQDSLKNGAIIGGAVGMGLVIAALAWECGSCRTGEVVAGIIAYTGIGAGVGVGIDALIPSKQTIFIGGIRGPLSHTTIAPILTTSRTGIAVSFSF